MLSTILYAVCLFKTHASVVDHFSDYCRRLPDTEIKLQCVDDVPSIKQLLLGPSSNLVINLEDFNDEKCGINAVYTYTTFPKSLIYVK